MKKNLAAPLVFLVILITCWEGACIWELLPPTLIPAPSLILKVLWDQRSDFLAAFFDSFANTLIGFFLSVVVGLILAFTFSLSSFLRRSVLPFAVFFQTVPIIAIAPLLVIYFGFGSSTVIAASFIVSLFPVVASTLVGLDQTPESLRELFKLYQASRWQTLWRLSLPSAVPSIYAGLKVSAGLSIVGTVAGEFVAGGGLGALIDSARTQQRVDWVFAALFLLSLMGLLMMTALWAGYELLNRGRPFARSVL